MPSSKLEAPLPFGYNVVRSRRRRTAVILIRDGAVEVRVPWSVGDDWIEAFVRSRRDWIASRLGSVLAQRERHLIEVRQGAAIPFCGQPLRLEWRLGGRAAVEVNGDRLLLRLSRRIRRPEAEAAGDLLRGWLQRRAAERLPARLSELALHAGLAPSDVSVRGFRRRWGSCDNRGRIALNWRLIFADPRASDYVLLHELCHLRHFDHSPRFWSLVARHCPDYRYWQDYLRARDCWLEW